MDINIKCKKYGTNNLNFDVSGHYDPDFEQVTHPRAKRKERAVCLPTHDLVCCSILKSCLLLLHAVCRDGSRDAFAARLHSDC